MVAPIQTENKNKNKPGMCTYQPRPTLTCTIFWNMWLTKRVKHIAVYSPQTEQNKTNQLMQTQ
ncbi:hypothetical protein Hanom_Chr12g01177371 [Helianthus anomalus]